MKGEAADVGTTGLRSLSMTKGDCMRHKSRLTVFCAIFILAATFVSGQRPEGTMAFIVSMEQPGTHIYHVSFRCQGLKGESQDFKMPAWSPGYYGIFDFAKNVQNFHAEDGAGKELKWEKATPNDWKVQTGNVPTVTVTYDALATSTFVANAYLGEDRGCIVGTGVFMYVDGQVAHPVTVEIQLNSNWNSIATGLDPVSPDKPRTFVAPDFDVLYDSPILMGNLESLPAFEIEGIPHYFIGYKLGNNFDRDQFVKDLKATIEQGIAVIGEIPYTHYTFLGIGPGKGGIEHLNSASVPFTGNPALDTRAGKIRELSFLGHEYFHNYNVKRIRPIALGPFDYDKADLTNMLWVSEGFTVYYEYLMVARAGFMNQEELLDSFRRDMVAYENNTGHLFQSATQSSWDTWSQGPFGGRGGGGISKSISYYNKGSVLGLLLDFKIRHETKNKKSLDAVMQTLYQKYYKQLKRGWTDEEFRAVCEDVAGVSLKEFFDYASTTKDIDYDKYLGYAGLELEKPVDLPDSYLGAIVEDVNGKLIISAIEGNSPAQQAKLAVNDEIKALDGAKVDAAALNAAMALKKPGDKITLSVTRAGKDIDADVHLGHKMQRSFKIIPMANPDALQSAILKDWMKAR
jgi:predicted metalloprotease with PDZ domain